MTAPSRAAAATGALCAIALAFYVAVVVGSRGERPASVVMPATAAWLRSTSAGSAVLVSGPTAEIVASVQVPTAPPAPGAPDAGGAPRSATPAQSGMNAYLADPSRGSVTVIDGATFKPRTVDHFGDPGQQLDVLVGPRQVYVANETAGVVTAVDPITLRPRGTRALDGAVTPGGAVVDGTGALWMINARTRAVEQLDGRTLAVSSPRAAPDGAALAVVGGHAVLVDRAEQRVQRLDGDRNSSCLGLAPADGQSAVATDPASRLYAVSGTRGTLYISDVAAGDCAEVVYLPGAAGHTLGRPIEAGQRIFVPDYTRGTIHLVDARSMRPIANLPAVSPRTRFDMIARGPYVFFNNPTGPEAGVIRLDEDAAKVRKLEKYSTTATGPPPNDEPRPPRTMLATPPSDQPVTAGPSAAGDVRIGVSALRAGTGMRIVMRAEVSGPSPILTAQWTYGDGSTGNGGKVSHSWDRPGVYTVGATVTTADGTVYLRTLDVDVRGGEQGDGGDGDGGNGPEPSPTPTPTPSPSTSDTTSASPSPPAAPATSTAPPNHDSPTAPEGPPTDSTPTDQGAPPDINAGPESPTPTPTPTPTCTVLCTVPRQPISSNA